MTSIYEAVTIHSVLKCHDANKGYMKIWYLYVQSTVQLLQLINASLNLPIYWCVGTSFKATLRKYLPNCNVSLRLVRNSPSQPSNLPLNPSKPSTAQINPE